jgi:lipopolysaccharide biosynthesis regulator YciM
MNRLLFCTILMALSLAATASNTDTVITQILSRGLDALEQQNPDQAAEWFIKGANEGNAEAQFQLALLMLNEQELTINHPIQAHGLMAKAADQGHQGALFWLQDGSTTTEVSIDIGDEEEDNPEDDC